MATICKHNQTGYCKFGGNCRYLHINDQCIDTKCANVGCQLRHPRACRYFATLGACKFGGRCAYLHSNPLNDEIISLQQQVCNLTARIDQIFRILEDISKKEVSPISQQHEASIIPQFDGNVTLQEDTENYVNSPLSQDKSLFTCGICDFTFPDPDDFKEHSGFMYFCSICDICFKTEEAGNDHVEEFHPGYPGIELRRS